MDALLVADRSNADLEPLTRDGCIALLPVANRPLIELALDELATTSIDRCHIAVSRGSLALRKHLGAGDRWGIAIQYVLTRGDEPIDSLIARLEGQLGDELLVMEIGPVRKPILSRFLELTDQSPTSRYLECWANRSKTNIRLMRRNAHGQMFNPQTKPNRIDLAGVGQHLIETLSDYHRVNLMLAQGRLEAPHLESEPVLPGLRVGPQSQIPPSATSTASVLAGANCRVHPEASLRGACVLSDDVMVDCGARLQDTVVLPGTYVPRDVILDCAVIFQQKVFEVRTGEQFHLMASAESCSTTVNPMAKLLASFGNRAAALILLLVSFPLWPLAVVAGLTTNGRRRQLLERFEFVSSCSSIEPNGVPRAQMAVGYRVSTGIPILRDLPLLWSVIRGDLELVGVRPRETPPRTQPSADWQRPGLTARPGLLNPPTITLPPEDASETAREMSESVFALQESAHRTLSLLARALVSLVRPVTWRTHP